ncbi:MAG: GTPase [archaeon]
MKYPNIIMAKDLIDLLIRQLKKEVESKDIYKYIIEYQKKVNDRFLHVYNSLPDYSLMPDYYLLMSKNICAETTMLKHKNHYLSTLKKIKKVAEQYKGQVKRQKEQKVKNQLKKEFLGRANSAIKKLEATNKQLIEYKKYFERIPNPKDLFTIILIGVPNSGKTTLLTQLTSANPEINSYSFTTKSLNIGYFKIREKEIQVVDTPGLIHMEFRDMNLIEKQTVVAIKTISDVILFLYNQYQGFEEQEKMFLKIRDENKDKKMFAYPSFGGEMKGYPNVTFEQIKNIDF